MEHILWNIFSASYFWRMLGSNPQEYAEYFQIFDETIINIYTSKDPNMFSSEGSEPLYLPLVSCL